MRMPWRWRASTVLEECLERLAQGESVDQCLERYPRYAVELTPLLLLAAELLQEGVRPIPEEEFRRGARQRLLSAYATQRAGQRRATWLSRMPVKMAAVGAVVVVLVVMGMASTYGVAANSVPGEPLYGVKQRVEEVRLALARSPQAQARVNIKLAEERVKESRTLVARGKVEGLARVQSRFRTHLEEGLLSAGVRQAGAPPRDGLPPGLQRQLREELARAVRQQAIRQAEVLRQQMSTAPPERRQHFQELLSVLEREYQEALRVLEEPGQ